MVLALHEMTTHTEPADVITIANWLNNPLQAGYFDVVLGDAVFPNIPWENRPDLYRQIIRLLKPKGFFLNRAFYKRSAQKYDSLEMLLDSFQNKAPTNQTAIELVFDLQLFSLGENDREASMGKVAQLVRQIDQQKSNTVLPANTEKILRIIRQYWLAKISEKVWIYPLQHEEETEYHQYFTVSDTYHANDQPYTELTPMYLLRKKR